MDWNANPGTKTGIISIAKKSFLSRREADEVSPEKRFGRRQRFRHDRIDGGVISLDVPSDPISRILYGGGRRNGVDQRIGRPQHGTCIMFKTMAADGTPER